MSARVGRHGFARCLGGEDDREEFEGLGRPVQGLPRRDGSVPLEFPIGEADQERRRLDRDRGQVWNP